MDGNSDVKLGLVCTVENFSAAISNERSKAQYQTSIQKLFDFICSALQIIFSHQFDNSVKHQQIQIYCQCSMESASINYILSTLKRSLKQPNFH